jgi:hypothetical protein
VAGDEEWSDPDADGVRTCPLDVGARVTLRGRRMRRRFDLDMKSSGLWPDSWRELLHDWLATSAAERRRWATLLGRSGHSRSVQAKELLNALLREGWVEVTEQRQPGHWVVTEVRFCALERLRKLVGLPNRDELASQWRALATDKLSDPSLARAATELEGTRLTIALRRRSWLSALDRWASERRSGTQRDFAYYASGQTKGIPASDWGWLETAVDLVSLGVDAHTPMLLLRAPLRMHGPGRIDLGVAPDFVGLTPQTIALCEGIEGTIGFWRLVENRTSFEHVARRYGGRDAVVWLPGYPPVWWEDAMVRLIALTPAQARIACDPDPAGVAIALAAGRIWNTAGEQWRPWHMNVSVLDRLPNLLPLTQYDRAHAERLLALDPSALVADLLRVMLAKDVKGEQEGLLLDDSD